MLRLPALLLLIVARSIQRELAHPANLVFQALFTLTRLGAGLAALAALYTHVERLAGWRLPEALVLLGIYHIASGLLDCFIEPNLAWFAGKVRQGELDDVLLQPVPSLFLASLGSCQPWALADVLVGLAIVGTGVAQLGAALTLAGLLSCLLLLLLGLVITWSSRVLLASLAFWAPGFEPSVLYHAFWQLGRYPVQVYRPAIRRLLSSLVPVAVVASFPAQALTRGVTVGLVLGALLTAAAAFGATWGVWRAGLRRYTGATS